MTAGGKLERGGLPVAGVRLGAGAVVVVLSPFWIMRFSRTSIWSAGREAARVEARALPAVAMPAAGALAALGDGPPRGSRGVDGTTSSVSGVVWVSVGAWAERERRPSIFEDKVGEGAGFWRCGRSAKGLRSANRRDGKFSGGVRRSGARRSKKRGKKEPEAEQEGARSGARRSKKRSKKREVRRTRLLQR